ncbi:MAG: S-methyl-5-thioribose-1-phosphate isomerase [Dehalococcoidia bacterium]|nr:S-methyl-5-thioribose-1-phosphate isomerase [Dehalococcoidia bacterium]
MKIIEWQGSKIRLLDQTRLPSEVVFLDITDYSQMCEAIKSLRVRGAPAIGVAAAYGLALGALGIKARSKEDFLHDLDQISQNLAATRPTAVNLFWALKRMKQVAQTGSSISAIQSALVEEAKRIEQETEESDRRIGQFGAEFIHDGFTTLTHCNAGALATAGYGTALGVIKAAHEQGKNIQVFADETRPLLQGARITAWELMQEKIPVTLITDNMAGYLMNKGKIDCVIVGADRITASGDVANKIGTYSVAVLAKEHKVPFYVAAPMSTIDFSLKSGDQIPIEERNPDEVTHIGGVRIAPEGVKVFNPAFDVTPHRYISAIITEQGVAHKPYHRSLKGLSTLTQPFPSK